MNGDLVYSNNEEEYYDDFETVLDNITGWICGTYEEALESTIYVGEKVLPKIDAGYLTNVLIDKVKDDLYEQCGEYSDYYSTSNVDELELKVFLEQWIAKQKFNVWSVKNPKEVPLTDMLTLKELKECYE